MTENSEKLDELAIYGADAVKIRELIEENPDLAEKIHPDFPYCSAEIVWAVRNEMAETVEDVLARRTHALFLNAQAAIEIAPKIARLMAKESGKKEDWIKKQYFQFYKTAQNYLY